MVLHSLVLTLFDKRVLFIAQNACFAQILHRRLVVIQTTLPYQYLLVLHLQREVDLVCE